MFDIKEGQNKTEKAISVFVDLKDNTDFEVKNHLKELASLAKTAGAIVVDDLVQSRHAPDVKYYIGKGKVYQLKDMIKRSDADTIIFNNDLSPAQTRNLEKVLEVKIIDRTMLILDIFASHARTYESKIQVELAQLNYLAPRLTGMWTHFSQQTGGIGTRGPGEAQLEVDKRIIKKRMADLNYKLSKIQRQRDQQKKRRKQMIQVCLVGYTNVGKSTILSKLSKTELLIENKLFATLDAATRKVYLPGIGEILMSDTVGFINDIPHNLIASFKSTLDVVIDSDLIVIVSDASSENIEKNMETVNSVLNDLNTQNIKRVICFNKKDFIDNQNYLNMLKKKYNNAIFISAFNQQDLEIFKNKISETLYKIDSVKRKIPDYNFINSI